MADDRIVISSEPGVTADEVARRSFPVVFRGFEQDEVRRFLHKVGDELRAAREREQELRLALDEARSTLAHPELDEATLTAALGEETARILRSAREAANDIRTKAEERVARMVQEADEHGARLRAEAENVLARRVEEADEVAANIRAAAEADAQAVHDRVQGEIESAKARGREMIAEAQAVRERIIGDLARRRRAAQIQIEQLLAGRDRLLETYQSVRGTLDDITAELAGAEDQARVAAEAAHHRVVSTPPDDSDLAAYAASGVEESAAPEPEPEPEQEPEREPEPESLAPAPDAWALPEPPVHPEPHVEPFDEEEGVRIIGPVTRVTVAPPQADPHPEPELLREPDPTVEPEPEPEPELVAESQSEPAPVMHQQAEGSVDDLFARLREEREAAVINAEKVLAPDAAPTVDEAPVEAPEVEPAVEASEETVVADGDRLLLERRDECIEPVAHDLVRRLKRVLQDEQNEILDRLRQSRGRTRPEEALPSAADQAGRYRDAATGALADAAHSGASFIGGATAGNLPARQWAQAMADELVGGLRDRVTRSLAAAGEGAEESDAADSLGAAYRQWKTERIEQIARHHLAAAFNQGILAGAPDGSSLRWVFGDAGPCPDCDDNALAGPTQKGESYPTGQPHPPAHAGCGCLLTPSEP